MSKSFILLRRVARSAGTTAAATVAISAVTLLTAQTAHAFSFSVAPAGTINQPTWNGLPTTQINFNALTGSVPTTATNIATSPANGNATIQRSGEALYTNQGNNPTGTTYLNVGSRINPSGQLQENQSGTVQLNFDAPRGLGYFGFFWGSPSRNDQITFTLRDAVGATNTVSYTAATIFDGIYDSTQLDTNNLGGRYVRFFATNELNNSNSNKVIASVLLQDLGSSNQRSFEIDNITYQAIPTPALLPGLVAMGIGVLRKRKQEEVAVR